VVGLLLVASACTLLLSYWASNRKETLTALDDERETAVRDFFTYYLAFLPVDLKPTYSRMNLCLFFSSLRAAHVNTCCQDITTMSPFPQLQSVTELNHAWWDIQLSTNLGWLTLILLTFTEVCYCVYMIKNFASVKLKQNQGKHLWWKHRLSEIMARFGPVMLFWWELSKTKQEEDFVSLVRLDKMFVWPVYCQ